MAELRRDGATCPHICLRAKSLNRCLLDLQNSMKSNNSFVSICNRAGCCFRLFVFSTDISILLVLWDLGWASLLWLPNLLPGGLFLDFSLLLLVSMLYFWTLFPPISCFSLARKHFSNVVAFLGQCAERMAFLKSYMLEHVWFSPSQWEAGWVSIWGLRITPLAPQAAPLVLCCPKLWLLSRVKSFISL